MGKPTETIRERLMVTDEEFQRLNEDHARYEAELEQLSHKRFLNEQDQTEEVRLKKLKLLAKDRMEQLVHRAMKV